MRRNSKICAWVLSTAFLLVAFLHVYWALGGTWALQESIGEGNPVPPVWSIWLVAGLALAAAIGVLGRIGVCAQWVPRRVYVIGAWCLFACLVTVTIMNALTFRPWEALLIAPLCAVLAGCAYVVARFKRPESRA